MNEENKTPETIAPVAVESSERNEPVVEAETVPAASDETSVPAEEPLPVAPEQSEMGEPVSEPAGHSVKYEKVLGYYKSGSWNEKQARNAVAKGWITPAEFVEITGKEY